MQALRFHLALALLIACPLSGAPLYNIVNLGGLGGARSDGFAIGAGGVAAGVSRTADQLSDLPVLYDGVQVRSLSKTAG